MKNCMPLIIRNIFTFFTYVLRLLNYKIFVCLYIIDFKMYRDWFYLQFQLIFRESLLEPVYVYVYMYAYI